MISHNWSPMKRLIWLRGSGITGGSGTYETITGNPVSFTAKAAPLRKLSVAFSPVQEGSGDPSPDNVRPILGWDSLNVEQRGKNLFDGTYEPLGVSADKIASTNGRTAIVPIKGGEKYTINKLGTSNRSVYYEAYETPTVGTSVVKIGETTIPMTVTTSANAKYLVIYVSTSSEQAEPQMTVVWGETASDYIPYNPSSRSISISIGSTVYSGTVDVVTGVVEIDKVAATLNALTKAAAFSNGNYSAAQLYLLPSLSTTVAANQTHGAISTSGKEGFAYFGVARTNEPFPYSDGAFAITTDGRLLSVYDSDKTITSEAFDAKYGTTQIVYPLEEPLTIQLTPQEVNSLAGDNVLFSDANGDLTVEYRSN